MKIQDANNSQRLREKLIRWGWINSAGVALTWNFSTTENLHTQRAYAGHFTKNGKNRY